MQDGFLVTELYNTEEKKEELKEQVSDMLKNLFDNHFGISNKKEVSDKCPCIGNEFFAKLQNKRDIEMYQISFSDISKERGKQYFEEFMQLIMQCHLESTDIIEYFQWQMQTSITNRDQNYRR